MTESERTRRIHEAFQEVADEMIDMGQLKSGHVLVHFQNGMPMKVEWRTLAEPLGRRRANREG